MQKIIRDILYLNGLAEAFDTSADFHLRLKNDPWLALVIERHGDEVAVTHYIAQNGDQLRDPEMVFSIAEWEKLSGGMLRGWAPKSVEPGGLGRVYPTGQVVHPGDEPPQLQYFPRRMREAISFANLWARNLRQQGFVKRYAANDIQTTTHPDALQAALTQEDAPIPIQHHWERAAGNTALHYYDLPADLPALLRRSAYRQALAALKRDFPAAEGQYPIARRSLGYVLNLVRPPDWVGGITDAAEGSHGQATTF